MNNRKTRCLRRAQRRQAREERRQRRLRILHSGKSRSQKPYYVLGQILSVLYHALEARAENPQYGNDTLNIGIPFMSTGEPKRPNGWTGIKRGNTEERKDTMGNYKTKNGVSGDEPIDICDYAISHLILYYEHTFKRRPTMLELDNAFSSALIANYKNGGVQSGAMNKVIEKMEGCTDQQWAERGDSDDTEQE